MAETALAAQPRSVKGSHACRKLRSNGLTPAVVYGHKEGSVDVQVASDDVIRMVREGHKLVDLDLGGNHEKVIIRDLQWDTYSKHVMHIDFMRVSKGELIEVELPLVFVGDAIGVANGGVMEHPQNSINVTCPALQIPDSIRVNVAELKIGDALHISDLDLPDVITVLDDPDTPIATIIDPAAMEAAVDAEDAAAAASPTSPEVVDAKDGEDDAADTAVAN